MLHHIVMWKFAAQADGHGKEENIARVREGLESLPARIPEIQAFALQRDAGIDAAAWDLCLITEFEDVEALERYRSHPAHVAVASLIAKVRESRAVIDYRG